YNSEQWLAQAIESALNQTYQNKEVIVVDDGSSDNSLDIIKSFGDQIGWETGLNRGGNPTRNRLLQLSSGDWLQYLDADDYLLPDKLEKQIQFLNSHPQADVICSPIILEYYEQDRIFRNTSGKSPKNFDVDVNFDPWLFLAQWRLPQTAGSLWNKKSLVEIGGWKEDLLSCQEYELYLRALMAGHKFEYYGEALSVYRQWSDKTVCKKNPAGTYKNRLKILDTLELYLTSSGQLTDFRKNAINQSRFDCARIIWLFDHQWALDIIQQIGKSHSQFVPSSHKVPYFYRLIYKSLGFNAAEIAAKFKRELLNRPLINT
ncbi:MAG: glycosyltransferase, partial [Nostocales cyanobacterium]